MKVNATDDLTTLIGFLISLLGDKRSGRRQKLARKRMMAAEHATIDDRDADT